MNSSHVMSLFSSLSPSVLLFKLPFIKFVLLALPDEFPAVWLLLLPPPPALLILFPPLLLFPFALLLLFSLVYSLIPRL